ncbi:MAG: TldD/PmbA family protein [Candidatus Njordarchaeales archaeon]
MKIILSEHILDLLDFAIKYGMELGADFIESRAENIRRMYIHFEKDLVKNVESINWVGIGITAIFKNARGYGFTTKLDKESIKEAVKNAVEIAKASTKIAGISSEPIEYKPQEYSGKIPSVRKHPRDFSLEDKIDLALSGIKEVLSNDVISLRTVYGEYWGEKYFMNSEGLKRQWNPIMVGLFYAVVVRENGKIGNGREQMSASMGLELFDEHRPESIAKTALRGAREALEAKTLESGKYPFIASPEFSGVLAHESFGHLTEGDYVATGASILAGKLNQQLGSEQVYIYDSGDPVNYGFWVPYDDEGVDARRVTLLEKGILVGYLHARSTAKIMNMAPTGNARAINYRFPPIVRMRNTYFGAGDATKEELFEMIKKGVYAEGHAGGQTEDTGNFTFAANRAYWVENGEIKFPLKAVVVRGHILDFLKNVIGASKDVIVKTSILGGCGKGGQAPLPVGLGGPYLAVKEAIISFGK